MKLIDTYQRIEKREILDCRIKSIKELVRHYGLNLNSYEVLLLCEAYTFNYSTIKIPGVSLEVLPYATASHNNLETTFFHNLNINYHKEKIAGSRQGWEHIKCMIDQEIPILFRIDSRFLRGVEDVAPKQMKLNLYYLSTLLLVGYDEEKGLALVVLTNDDEKEDVNEITIEKFQKYRWSICAPFSPDGLCFYMKSDNGIGRINGEDIKKAILSSIIKTADTMLNGGEIYNVGIGTFIGSEVRKGINGMQNLKEDMQMMLEQCKSNDNPKIIQLMMVFLRNNLMFGSYSAFREEFGQCLKNCAKQYEIHDLYDIGNGFEKIAHNWKTLFTLLSRIAHNKGDLVEQIQMVINVWDTIIQSEHEQFTKARSILTATFKQSSFC